MLPVIADSGKTGGTVNGMDERNEISPAYPHGQDVGAVADRFGVSDLGAFEMRPITDPIFADRFGDPISLVY
jgi:hypothetical protein